MKRDGRRTGRALRAPAARPWPCPKCGAAAYRSCVRVLHGVEEPIKKAHEARQKPPEASGQPDGASSGA